jgi:hypothetical protein
MNKIYAIVALGLMNFFSSYGYTKKIEFLKNPHTNAEVHIFYDFHADENFPGQAKQQVKEIIEAARKKNAHIIVENTFDYQGNHTFVKDDLSLFKYMRKALLLRDVHDKALKEGVSIENVEYRQDREYSVNENRMTAFDALDPVSQVLKNIKGFKGSELKQYYQDVLGDIEPIHTAIVSLFKPQQSIFKQLSRRAIQQKLSEIKKLLPTDCADVNNADVVLYYDARLLNPLIINSIYEKQVSSNASPCIFVIAGSFHAFEVSTVLQDHLSYELIKQDGTDEDAFVPAVNKMELAQVQNFFEQNKPIHHAVPSPYTEQKDYFSQMFGPSIIIV